MVIPYLFSCLFLFSNLVIIFRNTVCTLIIWPVAITYLIEIRILDLSIHLTSKYVISLVELMYPYICSDPAQMPEDNYTKMLSIYTQ